MNIIAASIDHTKPCMDRDSYTVFMDHSLNQLRTQGNYREFIKLERLAGKYPLALWHSSSGVKEVIVWCANDYLGMSQHSSVTDAMKMAVDSYGGGAGGTRNISGTQDVHVALENEIARLHNKEAGLLFTSGYVANDAILSTLASRLPECVVLSDQKNHASMIAGIRNSRVEKHIFAHNNIDDLYKSLKKIDIKRPKIIAVESVYSMDGTMADLPAIADLAKRFNALTYVDEVHAVGLYGFQGGGVSEKYGISSEIDIIQGTLGKAFGVMGGYMASSKIIADFIRSFASGFIFTTALSPVLAEGALASIRYLRGANKLREQHQDRASYLKKKLKDANINSLPTDTHIVPIIVGCPKKAKSIGKTLLEESGLYLQVINHPTVPKGTERFRLTPSPLHTENMIDSLVKCLEREFKRHNVE